ncbi:MAG: pilin [Xanthomonadaceae bacterium]|nr:pilin [Xanthomonadaceae bacterium]
MAAVAKLAVSESGISSGVLPDNNAEAGYSTATATDNVASINVGLNGVVTITTTALAGNGTIIMTPQLQANNDVTWTCTGGTLAPKYRPANCRPAAP